jgi:ataxia telangiectasia mutated family protein
VAEGVSIGDWLKPAHTRYQKPGEITTSDIREAIRSLQEKDHHDPKIKATYEEMIPRFPPVMRHFFKEKHKDPMSWFSMSLRYSRSAAVTSMVGWILGIGDRHLSNIMIDQHNGELIHIDFGIVFEAVSTT